MTPEGKMVAGTVGDRTRQVINVRIINPTPSAKYRRMGVRPQQPLTDNPFIFP